MGTWGVKLYQDDVTSEVKENYIDKLKRGAKDLELTQEMLREFTDFLNDDEEASLFWFALSDIQWNYGRLEETVKEKALYYLDKGYDLTRWEESKHYKKRKQILGELRDKLSQEQPKRKRVMGYRFFRCEWVIGDVFAIKLDSEISKKNNYFGKYMLFQKIDNTSEYPGHTVPVVRVFKWIGEELPTFDMIKQLTIMPVFYSPVVYAKEYSKKRGMKRDTVMYNMSIGYTAKRYVHKNLVFIGNLPLRDLERIGEDCRNIYWKFLEEELIRTYNSWKDYNVYDLMDGRVSLEENRD